MSHPEWDASYRADEPAPWDIGRPQPAFLDLAFEGSVLDAGCGTGAHAGLAASRGHDVVGIDVSETAIALARQKVSEGEFVVGDALHLETLGRTFDTVLDCGLFHTFRGDDRRRYAESLARVTSGTLHLLCFRDAEGTGPHPVSETELRDAFAGWTIESLEPSTIETNFATGLPAWLARLRPPRS